MGHPVQLAAGAYLPLQVMGLNVGADCKYSKGWGEKNCCRSWVKFDIVMDNSILIRID